MVTYAQHLRVQWWEGGAELGVRCRAQHCKATITELELMELHSFQDGSKDADRRGFRTKGYCKLLFIAMIAHILHLTVCLSGGRPSALRYSMSIPSPLPHSGFPCALSSHLRPAEPIFACLTIQQVSMQASGELPGSSTARAGSSRSSSSGCLCWCQGLV